MITEKTKIKIVLQGKEQSFQDYENEINKQLAELEKKYDDCRPVVIPTAAHDGRMCCVINFKYDEK